MILNHEIQQRAASLAPSAIQTYLRAKGWERITSRRPDVSIYRFAVDGRPEEVLIPQEQEAPGFSLSMAEVVRTLLLVEKRSPASLFRDLLNPNADILRFRNASRQTQEGTIPLNGALNLLSGARKALLSSACSVVQPQAVHPRLSRAQANELVERCKVGVEHGSFVTSLICPIDPAEVQGVLAPPQDGTPLVIPFTRKATNTLLLGAYKVVEALREDSLENLATPGATQYLSANYCEAIVAMQPEDQDAASLEISASWAPLLPPTPGVPDRVVLRREHFQAFEQLATALRPNIVPANSIYVGRVEALEGAPNPDGQMAGEVVLEILEPEEVLYVRVNLSPEDYFVAGNAHLNQQHIIILGELHRGVRRHRITNYIAFSAIERPPVGQNH